MKLIKKVQLQEEKLEDPILVAAIDQEPLIGESDGITMDREEAEKREAEDNKVVDAINNTKDSPKAPEEPKALIKESLNEDASVDELEAIQEDPEALGQSSLLTTTLKDLLNDEWEAVEGYQNAIQTIKANQLAGDEVIDILNDIIAEEYIHIGQLNKAMVDLLPGAAAAIKKGEAEAEGKVEADDPEYDMSDPVDRDHLEDDETSLAEDLEDGEATPLTEDEINAELGIDTKPIAENVEKDTTSDELEESLDDDEPTPIELTQEEVL